jgi:hypothetical protein
MSYSSNGNRPKLSEKGLLTPDNCVVTLIDHQGQMLHAHKGTLARHRREHESLGTCRLPRDARRVRD